MNPMTFWKPGDQVLILAANVLIQVTLITGVGLIIGAAARRNPAVRYAVLGVALLLALLSPALTIVIQTSGHGLLSVSLMEKPRSLNSSVPEETSHSGNPGAVASLRSAPQTPAPTRVGGPEVPIFAFEPMDAVAEPGLPIDSMNPAPPAEAPRSAQGLTPTQPGRLPTATPPGKLLRAVMPPLLLIWVGGAVVLLVRLSIAWRRLVALLRSASPVTNPAWLAILEQVCRDLRLARPPGLVQSPQIAGPISTGLFRPRVVLPESMSERVTDEQLGAILVHEAAHILRRDQLVVLFQNVTAAVFWLHPLVRVLNRRLARAREEICDNYVLAGNDAPSYSRTLLDLARLIQAPGSLPGAVGLFTSRWKLDRRVAGLLDESRSRMTALTNRGRAFVAALTAVLLTVAACGTMTLAVGPTAESGGLVSDSAKASVADGDGENAPEPAADAGASPLEDEVAVPDNGTRSVDVTGVVLDAGEPVAGAIVQASYMGFTGHGWRPTLTDNATTDAGGRFAIPMPRRRLSGIKVIARTPDAEPMALAAISPTMEADRADVRSWLEDPVRLPDFELRLTPSIRREIHVVDNAGEPIEAADVGLYLYSGWDFANAKTDADGTVVMQVPVGCNYYEFFARKQGFALDYAFAGGAWRGRRLPPDDVDSPVTLTLVEPAMLSVRVVNAITNQPVPDIAVRAEIPGKIARASFAGSELGYGLSALTNTEGVATVDWLPAWVTSGRPPELLRQESLRVWVRHPGYAYARTELRFQDKEHLLTLRMIPEFRLQGRVLHADGSPAAGIVVASWALESSPFDRSVTDDEGRYELAAPPDLGTVVSVVDDEWAAVPRTEFDVVRPLELARVADMVLQPPKRLFGRVTASEGDQPVAGQHINLHLFGPPRGNGLWGEGPPTRFEEPHTTLTTWTDETGHYEFHVGPGDYIISGPSELESADGVLFARVSPYWSLNIAEHVESREHNFEASIWKGETESGERPAQQPSENDANTGRPDNGAAANAPDATKDHRVVEGRVIDGNRNAVGGASVVLPINLGFGEQRRDVVQGVSDADGAFRLEVPVDWLEPPFWRHQTTLWVYKQGFALGSANVRPQLESDGPRDAVEIPLPRESKTVFTILDETGDPASNVLVEPQHYREPRGYGIVPQELLQYIAAETDDDGQVTIHGIEKGKLYKLLAHSVRHGAQEFRVDTLPDGGELQLREAVSLRGCIIRGDPAWRRNVRLHFTTERPRRITTDTPPQFGFTDAVGTAAVTTDAEGRFEIPLIATGNLRIEETLDAQLPVRLLLPESETVPVAGDLILPLEPAINVRGRVVRKDSQDAVAGVTVSVRYGQYRQGDRVVTDENGEFETRVLPGRVYQQVIAIPDPDLTSVGAPWNERFDVPITDEVFDLPVIELVGTWNQSGRLVDADGNLLADYRVWGVNGNRRYGFATTNDQGEFEMTLPNGVEMERYGYSSTDDVLGRASVLEAEPLRLRADPLLRAE